VSRWLAGLTLGALLGSLGACAESGPDLCQQAAAHLTECGAVPMASASADAAPVAASCDAALAARVLEQSCSELAPYLADPKADSWFGSLACDLGFYFACAVPSCPAAPDVAPSACGDLLAIDDLDDCRLCSYYDCREQVAQCGPDAYLVGYGARYCRRYAQVTEPSVSPEAAAWLQRVRRCLVTWLEDNVPYDASCSEIEALGPDSHAVCYVETGFCELSIADWTAIVLTIDPGDAPFRVMLATAQGCLARWLGL
jgi:hypothetical protein